MDCVIRVINGPDLGTEQALQPGPNLIGRGGRAALKLSPEDVSWEHAVITRDGDDYYIENLSAIGTWVGDAKISGRVRLKPRDKVRLSGDTVLRLDSTGAAGGLLSSRAFLGTMLGLMVAGLVAAVVFQGGMADPRPDDWPAAYNTLYPWLRREADRRRAPPEAAEVFANAWRLAQAGDYAASQAQWLRMEVLLVEAEKRMRCVALADKEAATLRPAETSLQRMLAPQTPAYTPTEDEKAAAVAQFTKRWLRFCAEKSNKSVFQPS